jgi:hypothetical protein
VDRTSAKRLLGTSVVAALIAYIAGVLGWLALVNALPAIASTLLPAAVVSALVFGVFRTIGRLDRSSAAALAAGFFLVHLAFWVVFATRTGLAHVTVGSECGTASVGEVYAPSDSKPDCDLTGNAAALFFIRLALLPVLGLLAGLGLRTALPGRTAASVGRERTF